MPLLIKIRSLLHQDGVEQTIGIRFLETQPHQFGVELNVTKGLSRASRNDHYFGCELNITINDAWG